MKVFATSDNHVDYAANLQWLLSLSAFDYTEDILILAGDLTDDMQRLEKCLVALSSKFKKVLFVPGNHELWVVRDKTTTDSLQKFGKVLRLCADCGVSTDVYHNGQLTVVPLFGWYDYSFGPPCEQLKGCWGDFVACAWPEGYGSPEATNYFVEMNYPRLRNQNEIVISFSHFLPRIDLMPSFIHPSQKYLFPVLGSTLLGKQVSLLQPQIHVYGHSHVNRMVEIDNVRYINNAFGYPSETLITSKKLLCIYEQ